MYPRKNHWNPNLILPFARDENSVPLFGNVNPVYARPPDGVPYAYVRKRRRVTCKSGIAAIREDLRRIEA